MCTRKFIYPMQFATCVYTDKTYERTQPGLAMTPSEVKNLADRGIPVTLPSPSTQPAESIDQGFFVEPMFRRSVDVNDLWQLQNDTKRKIANAHKRDVSAFG